MNAILRQAARVCVRVGLVNNMPKNARVATELQFRNLLRHALPARPIAFSHVSLAALSASQSDGCTAADAGLDALIVTGTEPKCSRLEDESYWREFAALCAWLARENVPAIFSCLAAHAAVLYFDGVRRTPLEQKCWGNFPHRVQISDEYTSGLEDEYMVAHSRWNTVSADALARAGYRVLTASDEVGVDLFVKPDRPWVFCQGHPEYDSNALAREYRRDVRRHLAGEREDWPPLPQSVFTSREIAALEALRLHATARRDPESMDFPFAVEAPNASESWLPPAAPVFGAWLERIVTRKAQLAGLAMPMPTSGRKSHAVSG